MPYIAPYDPFTPPASAPSTTPPTAFTPPGSSPSSTPPTAFTPGASTPSTTAPAVFFPVVVPVASTTDLAQQPTKSIVPAASEVVFIVGTSTWSVWTLTAGAHAEDATHIRPLDYDASLNAKHWLQTGSGTIGPGNTLIDSSGNTLTDSSGNPLIFQ